MKDKSLLIPRYRFKALTDVTPDDIRKMGAKGIGLDIDNVIAPDGTYNYAHGVREWVSAMVESGIPVTIISNGIKKRVKNVSEYLNGIPYLYFSRKPSPRNLLRAAKKMGIDITELAMLGDQLFSDIKAANRCGAIPVRIDPLPDKNRYPRYYAWRAKKEAPYLKIFEEESKKQAGKENRDKDENSQI